MTLIEGIVTDGFHAEAQIQRRESGIIERMVIDGCHRIGNGDRAEIKGRTHIVSKCVGSNLSDRIGQGD